MAETLKAQIDRLFTEGKPTRWIYPKDIPEGEGEWYVIQMVDCIHIYPAEEIPKGQYEYSELPEPFFIIKSKIAERGWGTSWPD